MAEKPGDGTNGAMDRRFDNNNGEDGDGGDYSSDQAEIMGPSYAHHHLVDDVTKSARSGEPSPITDWMANPDNKHLAFAPSLLPFDPSTPPWKASGTEPIQQHQQQQQQRTTVASSSDQQRFGAVHAEGLGEQQSPREMLNDRSHPQEVPVATAVPNGTRENKQKPLLFWVLLFATIVVVVVSVSIAVPVSIRLLNGPVPPEQVVPVPPGPGTRSPVAMEPTMDSQMTPSPITSAPDTTDPSTPAPTTPMPVTSPTTTTISFDELAGLIRSRLPSVSFTPTSSPEFRALQWMTETDTNINGLSEDRLVQRFAMVSIGFSISGFNNWHTSEPECSWGNSEEVQCNVSGEVITIEAKSSSFSGSIPVSIGLLTTIKEIEVSESDVAGSIPTEVGLLAALEGLILHSNRLTGTIPTEIGNLQALTTLYPPYNRLTGSIPTEIGRLHAQDTILMNSNQSTGSIPTEIGQLSGLVSLWFDNNQLSGSIPSTIGGLRALIWVYLDHNRLVGTVPTEVGLMTSLSTLVLYENTITGFMPAEVCEVVRPWIDCNEIICSCCVRNIARTPC